MKWIETHKTRLRPKYVRNNSCEFRVGSGELILFDVFPGSNPSLYACWPREKRKWRRHALIQMECRPPRRAQGGRSGRSCRRCTWNRMVANVTISRRSSRNPFQPLIRPGLKDDVSLIASFLADQSVPWVGRSSTREPQPRPQEAQLKQEAAGRKSRGGGEMISWPPNNRSAFEDSFLRPCLRRPSVCICPALEDFVSRFLSVFFPR